MKVEKGIKYDQNKLKWDLLPWKEVEEIVKVLTYGATKYAPHNWKKLEHLEDRAFAAAIRHLVAWKEGEKIDPESRLPHLAHAACNILFLLWDENNKKRGG